MKKTLLSILFFGALFTACKQQSDQSEIATMNIEQLTDANTNLETDVEAKTLDYLYKSSNGEIVEATFFEENEQMFIKIKRDNKVELVLEQTVSLAEGAEYGNEDCSWISENNDATFSDGKEEFKLVLISPLRYTFTNGTEDIVLTYFDKNDKRFVSIFRDNQADLTLEQTTAWAKGAEYGKDSIQWRGNGEEGVLIENGIESTYKEKK